MRYPAVRIIIGFVLTLVGIAGLFLPGIQGIAMILAGLLIVAGDIPIVGRWLEIIETRSPRMKRIIIGLRSKNGTLSFGRPVLILLALSAIWSAVALTLYYIFRRP